MGNGITKSKKSKGLRKSILKSSIKKVMVSTKNLYSRSSNESNNDSENEQDLQDEKLLKIIRAQDNFYSNKLSNYSPPIISECDIDTRIDGNDHINRREYILNDDSS